jgi:hypothetical protein
MLNFKDRLEELISPDNSRLWDAVLKAFDEALQEVTRYQSVQEFDDLTPDEKLIRRLRGSGRSNEEEGPKPDPLTDKLKHVFTNQVINRISGLPRITSADLTSIAIAQLTGLRWDDYEEITAGKKTISRVCTIENRSVRRRNKKDFIECR